MRERTDAVRAIDFTVLVLGTMSLYVAACACLMQTEDTKGLGMAQIAKRRSLDIGPKIYFNCRAVVENTPNELNVIGFITEPLLCRETRTMKMGMLPWGVYPDASALVGPPTAPSRI